MLEFPLLSVSSFCTQENHANGKTSLKRELDSSRNDACPRLLKTGSAAVIGSQANMRRWDMDILEAVRR